MLKKCESCGAEFEAKVDYAKYCWECYDEIKYNKDLEKQKKEDVKAFVPVPEKPKMPTEQEYWQKWREVQARMSAVKSASTFLQGKQDSEENLVRLIDRLYKFIMDGVW